MKILLVAELLYGSLGLSYLHAFKRLGYEVTQFDLFKIENKCLVNVFGGLSYKAVNENLINAVKINNPDLIFIIKGYCIFPETLIEIKKEINPLIFIFNPDNPFNFNGSSSNTLIQKSIPFYDCYFIWGKFLIPQLVQAGAKKVEYLPFAYEPELHYPVNVNAEEEKYYGSDVTFIGSWDKERERLLKYLVNYDLSIWGNGWNRWRVDSLLRKKWRGKPIFGEEFSRVCNASKIVLNLIRKQNGDAHNMRTFEVPACKGFMLTTRTKEQCEFFKEDQEMVCFETPDELIRQIDKYLVYDEQRLKFSNNAYNKIPLHTYIERARKVLEVYDKFKFE